MDWITCPDCGNDVEMTADGKDAETLVKRTDLDNETERYDCHVENSGKIVEITCGYCQTTFELD